MKIKEVILHHKNCDIRRCPVCYEDAMRLERYLDQETNDNNKHDILGHYRTWLDSLNIISENEFGWLLPSAYYPDNIIGFIKYFKEKKRDLILELKNNFEQDDIITTGLWLRKK